jgi:enamine deaminase RidA (YjgF/YER057c/UK114 family)
VDRETRPSSTHIQIESLLVPQALCGLQLIALTKSASAKKEMVVVPNLSTSPGPPFKPSPQSLTAGDFVFVTGQVASDFQRGLAAEASTNPDFWYGSPIKLQTDYIMKRFEIILKASGSSLANVVRADIYLTDMKDFYEFEEIWMKYFPEDPPARTFIPVKRLGPEDCIVEINMIAVRDGSSLSKETIRAEGVPQPDVHHPHAVRAGDYVFISGMYATDFGEGLAPEARINPNLPWFGSFSKKQTEYILKDMDAVCRAAGTRLENIVWMQNFFTDPRDFHPSSEVWQAHFPNDPPAALIGQVQTPQLIPDCTIMMDAVAVVTE